MKTPARLFLAFGLAALFLSPAESRAQKVTLGNVKATAQTLAQGEFQLRFEFALPDFDKAAPEKINIVYAVLAFEVEVLTPDSRSLNMLEALVSAADKNSPQDGLAYNEYPVGARIRREKAGMELVEVDITQIVDHWVHRGTANNGLLLVSQRAAIEKTLHETTLNLAPDAKPVVTIFYAEIE